VDLSSVSESEQRQLSLDLAGLDDALVTPAEVSVGIRIAPEVQRRLPPMVVAVEDPPDFEILLDPEEVEVVVRGAAARLDAAGLEGLRTFIPGAGLEGMGPGETRWVPVATEGVPELLEAVVSPDSVLVIRPLGRWEGDP
jgi:hypothetical protein